MKEYPIVCALFLVSTIDDKKKDIVTVVVKASPDEYNDPSIVKVAIECCQT